MLANYFLSGWIANFGVVPLFSFAFFLFAPIFLSFNFLRVRVCIVLEPILISSRYVLKYLNQAIFLTFMILVVKIFLFLNAAHAENGVNPGDIVLSKGEQTELTIENLRNFSVGNKEVISYKYLPAKHKILIKGKSLGFSDLIVWKHKGLKSIFRIYVISKREQLKQMEVLQILKGLNLYTKIVGEILYISGTISSVADYLIFQKINNTKYQNIIYNIELDKKISNQIIAEIYEEFYQYGHSYINCDAIKLQIKCIYEGADPKSKIIEKFKNKYQIVFQELNQKYSAKNLQVKFHIISVDSTHDLSTDSGLNKIQFNLKDALTNGMVDLQTDEVLLANQDMTAKIVTSPIVKTILDNNFSLQLGGEIPFQIRSRNRRQIQWKFAGLKIDGRVSLRKTNFLMDYSSELTNGSDDVISGPKGKSSIYLSLNKPVELFHIDYNSHMKNQDSIPVLGRIPLLKHFFSSTNKNQKHKKIIVYATLSSGEENAK